MRTPEAFRQALQLASAEVRDAIRENARLALAGETRTASGITAQHREVQALRKWHHLLNSTIIP